jgi:hypothetical protein
VPHIGPALVQLQPTELDGEVKAPAAVALSLDTPIINQLDVG